MTATPNLTNSWLMTKISTNPLNSIKGLWFVSFILILIVFLQNPIWPIWGSHTTLIALLAPLVLIIAISRFQNISASSFIVGFTLLLYFFVYHGLTGDFRISTVLFVSTLILVSSVPYSYGSWAFQKAASILALLLAPSSFLWLIHLTGINLPNMPIEYGDWKGLAIDNVRLYNYFFFIYDAANPINRFYSYFDEPGVLGTLCAFILFGLKYNAKDIRVWIILVSGLLTLSMAFYFLLVIGYVIYHFETKKIWISLIAMTAIGSLAIFLIQEYAKNNNILDAGYMLFRFYYFIEHGVGTRTGLDFNDFYLNFIYSTDVFLGMGTSFFGNNLHLHSGQSYRLFLVEYGLLGIVLVAMTYMHLIWKTRMPIKIKLGLIALFFFSFLQRPFLLTPWQIIIFWMIASAYFTESLQKQPFSMGRRMSR